MLYLRLPFFLLFLVLKNIESWTRILLELVGAQLFILVLIVTNILVGSLLYLELQRHRQLTVELKENQNKIEKHKVFWRKILEQFPTHKTALEADQVLEKSQ
jgi:hypothetical protein